MKQQPEPYQSFYALFMTAITMVTRQKIYFQPPWMKVLIEQSVLDFIMHMKENHALGPAKFKPGGYVDRGGNLQNARNLVQPQNKLTKDQDDHIKHLQKLSEGIESGKIKPIKISMDWRSDLPPPMVFRSPFEKRKNSLGIGIDTGKLKLHHISGNLGQGKTRSRSVSVQMITIKRPEPMDERMKELTATAFRLIEMHLPRLISIWVDSRKLTDAQVETLIENEGINQQRFLKVYNKTFTGFIWHFTDLKY